MKTKYRFIHFTEMDDTCWGCHNNNYVTLLGLVEWYKPWRQWVFQANNGSEVFSASCLADIQHFMGQLK